MKNAKYKITRTPTGDFLVYRRGTEQWEVVSRSFATLVDAESAIKLIANGQLYYDAQGKKI